MERVVVCFFSVSLFTNFRKFEFVVARQRRALDAQMLSILLQLFILFLPLPTHFSVSKEIKWIMPPPKVSFSEIAILGVFGEGEESLKQHELMLKRERNSSLKLPLEEHWQLPQEENESSSFSKLSIKSMMSYPSKFHDSLKRIGRIKSHKVVLEGTTNPKDEELVESFRQSLMLDGELPSKHDDYHTLLRFLRMRSFDLIQAKDAYLKMLKWREEFGVDEIAKVDSKLLRVIQRS